LAGRRGAALTLAVSLASGGALAAATFAAAGASPHAAVQTGYWLAGADGGVLAFGSAGFFGSMGGKPLAKPIVEITPTPDDGGYWLVATDGGVFGFGDAGYFGSPGCVKPSKACGGSNSFTDHAIVGLASTPTGLGYWMVDANADVFAFGDATYFGSAGCVDPTKPCGGSNSFTNSGIVAMTPTPSGHGYWLVAHHGSLYAFGDAGFNGSPGCIRPALPCGGSNSVVDDNIVGMAATPTGAGYWMFDSNANVLAFGDAPYKGSAGCADPTKACGGKNSFTDTGIVGMLGTADGGGYWLAGAHGSVFAFGDAGFRGSAACIDPTKACGAGNSVAVTDVIGMAG
jgi:hypothetical protein